MELPVTYQINEEVDISLVPHLSFGELKLSNDSIIKEKTYGARIELGYSF